MLVKLLCGTYGAKEGDVIVSKTRQSAPFEVEEKRGRQLIAMGYAEEIRHTDKGNEASKDTADSREETDREEQADTLKEKSLEDCTIQELRKIAKEKGLLTSGNKVQLIERIMAGSNNVETPAQEEHMEDTEEETPVLTPAEPEV